MYAIVYGEKPDQFSFISHTYLVTLIKLIIYLKLEPDAMLSEFEIIRILEGEYFTSAGINNLIENDYFIWLLHPRIIKKILF
ncbi:MAG: hypothetical protein ACFFAU_10270 [Candidatus Hodarchaeota archaeon]